MEHKILEEKENSNSQTLALDKKIDEFELFEEDFAIEDSKDILDF